MDAGVQQHYAHANIPPPPIPGDGETVKRIRKGTKSCVECRHRKIRCVWHSPHDAVCAGCKTRNRECVPQLYRRTKNTPKLSAKERISRLEQQIANLTSSAAKEEAGGRPTSSDMSPHHDGSVYEDEEVSSDDDIDNHFSTDGPTPEGPVHLQFLFDSKRVSHADEESEMALSQAKVSRRYLDHARTKLQRLMPSREDAHSVANYTSAWMAIYLALFPSTSSITNPEDMVSQYEACMHEDAHPINIAMFLMIFTVTALQVPDDAINSVAGRDKLTFARGVTHTVEATIVSHTALAITVEGIEASVMFLRLKLSLGGVRSLWLSLRRTIALAELVGLPRAWYLKDKADANVVASPASSTSSARDRLTQKAALWQAICATDRLASLMFNLPPATSMHKFPQKKVATAEGEILTREYMFELATVALSVQELDEAYALQQAHDEVYEKVLSKDRHLRSMKNALPSTWWTDYSAPFSAEHLTRFWHHYMTLRVHLPWALKENGGDYAYSRLVCIEAAEDACRRYCQIRIAMPPNFFICRIMDMQVFTAAVFLILSGIKKRQQGESIAQQQQLHLDLVRQVLETWKVFSDGLTAPFLKEANNAISSLLGMLQDPNSTATGKSLSLRIPLLGKVRFGRQEPKEQQLRPENLAQIPGAPPPLTTLMADMTSDGSVQMGNTGLAYQQMPNQPFNAAMAANTMPWLMQLDMNASSLQDPFFVGEDLSGFDMWTGMENMPMDFGNNVMG